MIQSHWPLPDGRIIRLIRLEDYHLLPTGITIYGIDGTTATIDGDTQIDLDTRYGYLAYGLLSMINDYQRLALVNYTLHHMLRDDDLTHCAIGLGGEIAEVFENGANLPEELGDLLNYCCVGYRGVHTHFPLEPCPVVVGADIDDLKMELVMAVSRFTDGVKRRTRYNDMKRFSDTTLCTLLNVVWYSVIKLCYHYEFNVEAVMVGNIDKLATRYPGGYTDYLANKRLDKDGAL